MAIVAVRFKPAVMLLGIVILGVAQIAAQPGIAQAMSAQQRQLYAEGINFFDVDSSANCSLTTAINDSGQEFDLASIAQNYGIKWAEVKQLGGPVVGSVSPTQSPPTVASILKIIIADAFFQTNPNLSSKVKVTAEENYFKDGGADGSAKNPRPGQTISLSSALQQTLTFSSDTDANVLIDATGGLAKINSMMPGLGYSDTKILSYYNSRGAGAPNQTSAADITKAMDKIFMTGSGNYPLARKYLEAETVNYGLKSDANKWGGTSKVSDNTALFKNIAGQSYIITMFIDQDYQGDTNGATKDSGPFKIKNATEAVINQLNNGAGAPVSISPAATDTLPADLAQKIKQNQPTYEQAAQATNVPWQLLAAIHYRETGLSANGPNLFQITGYAGAGDFLSQATAAGNFLQKIISGNLPNHRQPLTQAGNDPEEIKDTLFSYNGRAQVYADQAASLGFNPQTQPYEGSPYVMNNYDAVHKNMQIITHDNGGLDGVDTRFGAFAIYAALLGYSGSSVSSCTDSSNLSSSLPSGNPQQLAQQILSNSGISFDYGSNGSVAQPFKDLAAGNLAGNDNGCPAVAVSIHILQEILLLASKHKVNISSLTTGHPCGDVHTLGRAVDINILDGKHLGTADAKNATSSYDTALSNTLMSDALPALPPGSGFGDCDGHQVPTDGAQGIKFFADFCNHVHTQVPPGS